MKIIGKDEHGKFIAVVSRTEIEKVFDHYYSSTGEKLRELKIGDDIDLGTGYDFRSDIKSACQKMVSASKEFHDAQKTLFAFAQMVSKIPVGLEPAAAEKATA